MTYFKIILSLRGQAVRVVPDFAKLHTSGKHNNEHGGGGGLPEYLFPSYDYCILKA